MMMLVELPAVVYFWHVPVLSPALQVEVADVAAERCTSVGASLIVASAKVEMLGKC
jgi:hypothetical protein